jgi:hypothetical protein
MAIDPVQYARRWTTLGVLSPSLVIIGLDHHPQRWRSW